MHALNSYVREIPRPVISEVDIAWAHHVRYHDAMMDSWMAREGYGRSFREDQVPPWIDRRIANRDRSRAEVIRFINHPLAPGACYYAYRASQDRFWAIITWAGDILAVITHLGPRGFRARGIDGRLYYGRHNGPGFYCVMRLSKRQPRQ